MYGVVPILSAKHVKYVGINLGGLWLLAHVPNMCPFHTWSKCSVIVGCKGQCLSLGGLIIN